MLILHYNHSIKSEWRGIDGSFDVYYNKNWMLDPAIPYIVKSIDGCKQLYPNIFEHDEFGMYSSNKLSGGTKTIIMSMMFPEEIFPMGNLGPNCAEALYLATLKHNIQFSYKNYIFEMHPDIKIMLVYENCKVIPGKELYKHLR